MLGLYTNPLKVSIKGLLLGPLMSICSFVFCGYNLNVDPVGVYILSAAVDDNDSGDDGDDDYLRVA